jgi:hypothetical protein
VRLAGAILVGVFTLAACQPEAPKPVKENIAISVDAEGRVAATRNGRPMTEAELAAYLSANNTGAGEPKP